MRIALVLTLVALAALLVLRPRPRSAAPAVAPATSAATQATRTPATLAAPEVAAPEPRTAAAATGLDRDPVDATAAEVGDTAPLATVTGRVVDEKGHPVAGARVGVTRHIEFQSEFGATFFETKRLPAFDVTSATDGSFEVRDLPADEYHVLAALDGHVLHEELVVEAPAAGLTLVLERAGSIAISTIPAARDVARLLRVIVAEPGMMEDITRTVTFLHEGSTLRTDLLEGVYDIHFMGRLNRRALLTVRGVRVVPGEVTRDGRLLDLDLRQWARVVRVLVEGPDGTPRPGVTVFAYSEGGGRGTGTDEHGVIEFVAGDEGVDIGLSPQGFRRMRLNGVREDVVLRLSPPLDVLVLRAPGAAGAARALVVTLTPHGHDGKRATATLEEDSDEVLLSVDAPGRYGLTWALALDGPDLGGLSLRPRGLSPALVDVEEGDGETVVTLTPDRFELARLEQRATALAAELVRREGESDEEFGERFRERLRVEHAR